MRNSWLVVEGWLQEVMAIVTRLLLSQWEQSKSTSSFTCFNELFVSASNEQLVLDATESGIIDKFQWFSVWIMAQLSHLTWLIHLIFIWIVILLSWHYCNHNSNPHMRRVLSIRTCCGVMHGYFVLTMYIILNFIGCCCLATRLCSVSKELELLGVRTVGVRTEFE